MMILHTGLFNNGKKGDTWNLFMTAFQATQLDNIALRKDSSASKCRKAAPILIWRIYGAKINEWLILEPSHTKGSSLNHFRCETDAIEIWLVKGPDPASLGHGFAEGSMQFTKTQSLHRPVSRPKIGPKGYRSGPAGCRFSWDID